MKKYISILSVITVLFTLLSCSQPNNASSTDRSKEKPQTVEESYIGKWNRYTIGSSKVEIDIKPNELSGFVTYNIYKVSYKLVFASDNWKANKTEGLTADIIYKDLDGSYTIEKKGKITGYFKNPEKTILQLQFYDIKEPSEFPDRIYLADKVFY